MRISPAKLMRGRVRMPGDKSVSHRAAILAALAEAPGRTRVSNYSTGADCSSTLACLAALGVEIRRDGADVIVGAAGSRLTRAPAAALDCGNSGTTMRLLAGVLAGQAFASTLTGDDSLRSRPMRRIIEPLELMGARIDSEDGRAPLHVEGRNPLAAVRYKTPVASAQVKSCVLLAGLNAGGRTEVAESRGATRDHTERLLRWFGVEVTTRQVASHGTAPDGGGATATDVPAVSIEGGATLRARDVAVPGDISSAAFFAVAAAMLDGSDITLEGVGLNPTRVAILQVLSSLGADLNMTAGGEESNEPAGDIRVRGVAALAPARADSSLIAGTLTAALIDELPILAVAGTRVRGGITIRDAAELRVKESDRISVVVENLLAMGAEVEEHTDGLTVGGPARLRGARVHARGDHRVAMAFAVAALAAEGDTVIDGAECVGVSFPEFFPLLESIAVR